MKKHTGESKPPLCEIILRADPDKNNKTPPKLSLPVTLIGVRGTNSTLQIERLAEGITLL